jgi:hypothetical protein
MATTDTAERMARIAMEAEIEAEQLLARFAESDDQFPDEPGLMEELRDLADNMDRGQVLDCVEEEEELDEWRTGQLKSLLHSLEYLDSFVDCKDKFPQTRPRDHVRTMLLGMIAVLDRVIHEDY